MYPNGEKMEKFRGDMCWKKRGTHVRAQTIEKQREKRFRNFFIAENVPSVNSIQYEYYHLWLFGLLMLSFGFCIMLTLVDISVYAPFYFHNYYLVFYRLLTAQPYSFLWQNGIYFMHGASNQQPATTTTHIICLVPVLSVLLYSHSNLAIAAKRLLLMRFIGGIRLFHFGFPLWTSNRNANLLSCLNFLKTRTKHSNDEPLIKFNSMNFSINVLCSVGEIKSHHQFVMKRLIIIELILIWIILIRLLTHSSFYFVAISNLIWQRKR